jgi:hypothetical protein
MIMILTFTGADPGFQARGGALKKIAPSGGRHEKFWGISCEKSRIYAKKITFFPIFGGATPPPPDLMLLHEQEVLIQVNLNIHYSYILQPLSTKST